MAKKNRVRFGDAFNKMNIMKKSIDDGFEKDLNGLDDSDDLNVGNESATSSATESDKTNSSNQPSKSKDELYSDLGIKYVDLVEYKVDETAVVLLSNEIAKKYNAIPIGFDKERPGTVLVAMADPLDVVAVDDISIILNMRVIPLYADLPQISILIDKFFGKQAAQAVADEYRSEFDVSQESDKATADMVADAPIVQLVKGVIEQAVHRRASDIHIEPLEDCVRLRYRVDGVLVEIMKYDLGLLPVIVSRVKIISGLDIAEKRIPQDGRATAVIDGNEFDIRVSTLPTVYGEKVVMRLNAKNTMKLEKTRLGLRGRELEDFDGMLAHPHGIILVTGPTGSGKTTTLYTALSELNREGVNIITVEDPVEVNIAGVNQVQVNEKAGLTFANALRSILRQDPDIIMIGEIRDGETAGIAVQAAITGHLVVSTIHTNSTSATVARLIDMGVEPFLAADALVGIIAQRLARRLCTCKEAYEADAFEKKELGLPEDEPYTLYRQVGCPRCSHTGFFGRIGVYETMKITPEIRTLIADKATSDELKRQALKQGMSTLFVGLKNLVKEGITSISEMRRAECADE